MAYIHDETSQFEVYVDEFPTRRERQQVSIKGGLWPMWSEDGRRLYFLTLDFRHHGRGVTVYAYLTS